MKRADAHAEDRKVEATNQIISQADSAYGNYMELHDMQRADLDRSMLTLAEAMDQEARRRADTNDELFQQEFVENDKQRGLDHLAKIQKIVEKQESVYRNIMAKVTEGDAQPKVRKERTDPTDEPNDAANLYRKRNDASVRVANACVVANSHVRKQARYDRFHQNRHLIAIADNEKIWALKASHAEADRLAERRQHELVEKQFHKTLASQQKRNEQQKMLKEIQRFQDHQFELLQLKHHPESVSTQKHLPPVHHPQAPQTAPSNSFSSSSKSEPNLRSLNHEPIYRDIQQSHKLFASTLDKWRSFESDNEKRTEAYWRKMLQGERKKESENKGNKLAILKRRVTEINAVRKFVQHTQKSIDGFEIENIDHVDDWTEENIDPSSTPPLSPTAQSPSDAAGRKVYSERLEKIRYFQEQKERLAFEKRQRDMKFLEEKVMRSKKMNQERAAKAAESIRQWEEKNMASTMRRRSDATKNDGELHEKMESRQQMLDEKKERENQERDEYFGAKNLASLNVREAAKANLAETKKAFRERQAEKNEMAQVRLEERMRANERNVSAPEAAREKYERKQSYEQNHSAMAQKEIDKKLSRHEEAKKRVAKPTSTLRALQKQRLLQKDKEAQGRRLSGSELALPPELTLPANLFLQSPSNGRRRLSSEMTETDPIEMSPSGAISPSADSPISPGENQVRPRQESRTKSMGLLSVGGESGSAGLPSPVGRQGPSPTGGSSPHSILVSGSDDDDSSNEDTEGFLQDLQGRSSKWLQDIRKKSVLV